MDVSFKMNGSILVIGAILLNTYLTNAYVLVQVRNKGSKQSDIDPVIHKTVSHPDMVDELTHARKHNMDDQPEMRSRHHRDNDKEFLRDDDSKGNIYVNLEVNKNNKKDNKTAILRDMEQVVGVVLNKIGQWTMSGFNYRSKDPLVVPKKQANLRSKPSLMYEVNTNSVMDVMSHVLASEQTAKLVDVLSKKAAIVYRTHFK